MDQMTRRAFSAAGFALLLAPSASFAQQQSPTLRVHGTIEQADGPMLTVKDLPPEIRPAGGEVAGTMNNLVGISIEQAEKELIRNTLKLVNGNREQAARILGIGERTLYRKIKEYDL